MVEPLAKYSRSIKIIIGARFAYVLSVLLNLFVPLYYFFVYFFGGQLAQFYERFNCVYFYKVYRRVKYVKARAVMIAENIA